MRVLAWVCLLAISGISCGDEKEPDSGGEWGEAAVCTDGLQLTGQLTMADTVMPIRENRTGGLIFTTEHKIDVDLHEAGCISQVDLQIEQGGLGCRIALNFEVTESRGVVLSSLALTADSYCPEFDDALEGEYASSGATSLDVWGMPVEVEMETGTEERVCMDDLDLRFLATGVLQLVGTEVDRPFELDIELVGDHWSTGSTSADCSGSSVSGDDADVDAGGSADDADGDGDSDADAGGDPNADNDGDGFTVSSDCDDTNGSIYPGASEIPYDGIDQDCDGSDLTDADGDGHDAIVAGGDDCVDTDADIHPGATEVCDSLDNDCDFIVDEEDAIGCTQWYNDQDDDGYGVFEESGCFCGPTGDYTANGTEGWDCEDDADEVNPGYAGWATFDTPGGNWDWNCDGAEELESMDIGSCSGTGSCSVSHGWDGAVPACGETALWVNDCVGLTCDESGEMRVQRCR